MTIGELANLAGVGVETVRYYEREGLIEQPRRRGRTFRKYPAETIARIRFIRAAKDLGFSLKEVGELLALRVDPRRNCTDVQQKAFAKIADIDAKLASLRGMRDALTKLADACDGEGAVGDCPILDALESPSEPSA